jgi:hypothetical protein
MKHDENGSIEYRRISWSSLSAPAFPHVKATDGQALELDAALSIPVAVSGID